MRQTVILQAVVCPRLSAQRVGLVRHRFQKRWHASRTCGRRGFNLNRRGGCAGQNRHTCSLGQCMRTVLRLPLTCMETLIVMYLSVQNLDRMPPPIHGFQMLVDSRCSWIPESGGFQTPSGRRTFRWPWLGASVALERHTFWHGPRGGPAMARQWAGRGKLRPRGPVLHGGPST